jgi:hypothetical protein
MTIESVTFPGLTVLVLETETDLIVTSIYGIMFYLYSLSFYM